MALAQSDLRYLEQRGWLFSTVEEGNMTCVVFPQFLLPAGYTRASADLLIRLSPGFPDVPPDMWWFEMPGARLKDAIQIPNTDSVEVHLGRSWQRWSRHLAQGQWQSGVDSLESFLALIRRDIERWAVAICVP